MKKHLLGTLIFLAAFFIGFFASPIRFSAFADGSGMRGGFTAYSSTYFVKLNLGRQPYDTAEEADAAFNEQVEHYSKLVWNQKVLEAEENRALISFETEWFGLGYCVLRKEKTRVYTICSVSLGHVLEFERQFLPRK
jgi:hypothetical protein